MEGDRLTLSGRIVTYSPMLSKWCHKVPHGYVRCYKTRQIRTPNLLSSVRTREVTLQPLSFITHDTCVRAVSVLIQGTKIEAPTTILSHATTTRIPSGHRSSTLSMSLLWFFIDFCLHRVKVLDLHNYHVTKR